MFPIISVDSKTSLRAGNRIIQTRNGIIETGNGIIQTGNGIIQTGNGIIQTGNGIISLTFKLQTSTKCFLFDPRIPKPVLKAGNGNNCQLMCI